MESYKKISFEIEGGLLTMGEVWSLDEAFHLFYHVIFLFHFGTSGDSEKFAILKYDVEHWFYLSFRLVVL